MDYSEYKNKILSVFTIYDTYKIKCAPCEQDNKIVYNCVDHCDFCNTDSKTKCAHRDFHIVFNNFGAYKFLYFNFSETDTKNIYITGILNIRTSKSEYATTKNYASIQITSSKNFVNFIETFLDTLKNCQLILLDKKSITISDLITNRPFVIENINTTTNIINEIAFDVRKSIIKINSPETGRADVYNDEIKVKNFINDTESGTSKHIEGSLLPIKIQLKYQEDTLFIRLFFAAKISTVEKSIIVLNSNNPLSNIYNTQWDTNLQSIGHANNINFLEKPSTESCTIEDLEQLDI